MKCPCREHCLRQQGFTDVFRDVKAEENAKALALLPGVLRQDPCPSPVCSNSYCSDGRWTFS